MSADVKKLKNVVFSLHFYFLPTTKIVIIYQPYMMYAITTTYIFKLVAMVTISYGYGPSRASLKLLISLSSWYNIFGRNLQLSAPAMCYVHIQCQYIFMLVAMVTMFNGYRHF